MTVPVPPPPQGPGVQAPFAAPPTERDRKRLWIGLGVGAALLVLCCGGGAFGIGALVVNRTDALRTEAASVTRQYLGNLQAQAYSSAYRLLCNSVRGSISLSDYADLQRGRPRIVQFSVGSPSIQGSQLRVPAEVQDEGGDVRHPVLALVEEGQPAALRVCGGE